MIKNNFVWKIGGEAGFGIMASGAMFAKALMRQGLNIADFVEYPSLIRGGHNTYIVRVSGDEIHSPNRNVDILVALNKETITLHEEELTPGGAILFDGGRIKEPGFTRKDLYFINVPFLQIAKDLGAEPIMMNTVSIGASMALVNADFTVLTTIFEEMFGRKGKEIVEGNVKVAKAGHDYIKQHFTHEFGWGVEKIEKEKRMLITGSEAIGMAAFKAGCKFLSAYPMTPSNNLTAYMIANDEKMGLVYKQPEDEIAAVNMAIGASFAGVRSMTATAGGGFALMVEAMGLAGMSETPLVVVSGMRPGPATGLPTWTGQADVRFVLHAAPDEFPRFVLAPGDLEEAFQLTFDAFNLADKYQTPVILLTDKNLHESHWSVVPFKTDHLKIDRGKMVSDAAAAEMGDTYVRYRFTTDGVSPRKIPGQPGKAFLGASDEHTEDSLFNEHAENRVKMMNKRMRKLESALMEIPEPKLYGPAEAKLTILAFGTTKGAILDALTEINREKPVANYLHYTHLWPLPVKTLQDLVKKGQKLMCIEGNYSGQFAGLLIEHAGAAMHRVILKYDGRQFFPEEIVEQVASFAGEPITPGVCDYITIGGEDKFPYSQRGQTSTLMSRQVNTGGES